MDAVGPVRNHEFELPTEWNVVTHTIIACAMEVHTMLGPGLLERLYEEAMAYELGRRGMVFQRQFPIRMRYKNIELPEQRLDLVVENLVVVELKAIESVADNQLAQLTSYLRSASLPLGLLINFNCARLKDGIYRRINSSSRVPGIRSNSVPTPRSSAPSASSAFSSLPE